MERVRATAVLAATIGLAGLMACSSRNQSVAAPPLFEAEPEVPSAPVSEHPATIVGRAPKAREEEAPAVVVLHSLTPLKYPDQTARPLMDQMARRFTPGVMVVRTGQPADFRNDDDVIHNVRVRERNTELDEPAFNIALTQGGSYLFTFKKDAIYDVKCDMHQNMSGVVVSSSSPYSAVADEDGAFTIDNVQPGSYTVVLYTATGTSERPLEVNEGQRVELDLAPHDETQAPKSSRSGVHAATPRKRPAG
jgi:plastocyanin